MCIQTRKTALESFAQQRMFYASRCYLPAEVVSRQVEMTVHLSLI